MRNKKRSTWTLLNPMFWIEAARSLLAALFGPLLRWLGLLTPPSTNGFQDIQKSDVDEAGKDAANDEAAVDAILQQMSPAQVVKAYAAASPNERALMDLSALDSDDQNWLLNLSDDDLTLLAMSTTCGCARSLESKAVKPIYPRHLMDEKEAEILAIPTPIDEEEQKRQFIAARVRALFHAPGVSNLNAQYLPNVTLH